MTEDGLPVQIFSGSAWWFSNAGFEQGSDGEPWRESNDGNPFNRLQYKTIKLLDVRLNENVPLICAVIYYIE